MKSFYKLLLISALLFPLFAWGQSTVPDTSKSPAISAPVHFFAGVVLNGFSTKVSSSNDALNNAKASKSSNPGFNLGVDIPLDQNSRWLFRGEAGITFDKVNFIDQYTTGSVTQMQEALSFKQTIINITPQVILNVVKTAALDVYVSTGIAIDIRGYSNKVYTTTTTYTTSGTTSTSNLSGPDFKSATFCVPAKAGVVIVKHLNIYAAYNAKTSLNNESTYSIDETSFAVGVNYIFGLK